MQRQTSALNPYKVAAFLKKAADQILCPVLSAKHEGQSLDERGRFLAIQRGRLERDVATAFSKHIPDARFVTTSACAVDRPQDYAAALLGRGCFIWQDERYNVKSDVPVVFIDAPDGEWTLLSRDAESVPLALTVGLWSHGAMQMAASYFMNLNRFVYADENRSLLEWSVFPDGSMQTLRGSYVELPWANNYHLRLSPYHGMTCTRAQNLAAICCQEPSVADAPAGLLETRCTAASVYAMLTADTGWCGFGTRVCGVASPYPPSPSRYLPLAYLVEHTGGVAMSGDGSLDLLQPHRGIVLAKDVSHATRLRLACRFDS